MKVGIFLGIYLLICFFMGVMSVERLGAGFVPVYLLAVVVGGAGAAYTIKHHCPEPESDDE